MAAEQDRPSGESETTDQAQRPLREPRPVYRPHIDNRTQATFSRPPGVRGAIDPSARNSGARATAHGSRGGAGSGGAGYVDASYAVPPAHAEAFGKPAGATAMLDPQPTAADAPSSMAEAAARERSAYDDLFPAWRNPRSAVSAGAPAVAPEPHPEVLDLVGSSARGSTARGDAADSQRLSVREVFFGRRLSWQALAGVGAAVAVIALLGGVVGNYLAATSQVLTSNDVRLREAPPAAVSEGNVVGEVANAVQPAVVNIQVTSPRAMGEGSGVVIDDAGYILTNNHVVTMEGGAGPDAAIEVVFASGQRAAAEIVGTDPLSDLAVIKVDVDNLTVAQLGNSDEVEVGQQVIAFGSPLGLPKTVTSGIVSATRRAIALGEDSSEGGEVIDAVQTDAAINPGNSGGPLVDTRGAVIGINTLIFTQSGGSDGLGFAIPINEAKRIAETLIRDGSITHPSIGVNARTAENGSLDGAEVVNVRADSPAERGGIREGDVIVKMGEREVHSADELVVATRNSAPGTDTAVTVVRDGGRVELTVQPEA